MIKKKTIAKKPNHSLKSVASHSRKIVESNSRKIAVSNWMKSVASNWRKSVSVGAALALVFTGVIWIEFSNPFLLDYGLVRFSLYSFTIFVPVVIEILLGVMGFRLDTAAFYVIAFAYHFVVFSLITHFYFKTPANKKKRFFIKLFIATVIFLAAALYYLLYKV